MAQMVFNKPSISVIEIDKANFNKNKEYLESQAKLTISEPNKEEDKI